MPELLDLLPIFAGEDEETVRARWIEWANEGLDPTDHGYVDTRDGGFWSLTTMLGIREFARMYDLMGTEVVGASHPAYAWSEYLDAHASVFGLERLPATTAQGAVTFSGVNGTLVSAGTRVGAPPADPTDPIAAFEVTEGGVVSGGVVTLPVRAVSPGSAFNLAPGSLTIALTPIEGVTSRTNAGATTGGTDAETDEGLRDRLFGQYVSTAAGNQHYYRRIARAYPGVGRVTVVPLWNGPGTVRVVVSAPNGDPVPQSIITALQDIFDPVAGLGQGQSQIGATVTVATASVLNLTIAATIEFASGYSLDGAVGTIALRAAIQAAISSYVNAIEPGGEVVLAQVEARIALVLGVHDVGLVSINAGGNLAVPASPPRIPRVGTYTLVSGTL